MHILTKSSIELAKEYFGGAKVKFFHSTTLAAVPFRNLTGFSSILSLLEAVDGVLLKLPGLRWLAWQMGCLYFHNQLSHSLGSKRC